MLGLLLFCGCSKGRIVSFAIPETLSRVQNILIDDNDQPIVTDFGLVHLSKEVAAKCNVTVTDPSVGRPIARRGTVRYMAPEVFLHKVIIVPVCLELFSRT